MNAPNEQGATHQAGTGHSHEHGRCICCEANDALHRLAGVFGPSGEVRAHFKQSRVEFLKGIRKILDERIERMSKSGQKGTRVVVD